MKPVNNQFSVNLPEVVILLNFQRTSVLQNCSRGKTDFLSILHCPMLSDFLPPCSVFEGFMYVWETKTKQRLNYVPFCTYFYDSSMHLIRQKMTMHDEHFANCGGKDAFNFLRLLICLILKYSSVYK